MSNLRFFAKIENETVVEFIVADPAFIEKHKNGEWIEAFKDGRRANFPTVGSEYNRENDVFLGLKPDDDSWILNTTTWRYEPPNDSDA